MNSETPSARARSNVGFPIQEAVLVQSIMRGATGLFRPGSGRSVYAILEPNLGFGRPDVLLVSVSEMSFRAHVDRGFRLSSLASAQVLERTGRGEQIPEVNVSLSYQQSILRDLNQRGLSFRDLKRAGSVVNDSLAIEAKLTDWRRAIEQVARYRSAAHQVAIAMPEKVASRVPESRLTFYGAGLIREIDSNVSWVHLPSKTEMAHSMRAWVLEVLVRGVESGTAYRLSASRKSRNAATNERTLGE